MGSTEIDPDGMDWVIFTQVRNKWQAVVYTIMNLRVP
jgi:hypothetical protein